MKQVGSSFTDAETNPKLWKLLHIKKMLWGKKKTYVKIYFNCFAIGVEEDLEQHKLHSFPEVFYFRISHVQESGIFKK